jgi:uracil-DNA glycosylase
VREVFGMLPDTRFNEIYFTNLVKCRFREKPGRNKRNITDFIADIAAECYSKFLGHEIRECANAKYVFSLGRDTFAVLSKIMSVAHPSLDEFKLFYGTKLDIPVGRLGRTCCLVPLPHQPTYNLGVRYARYGREEVRKRLEAL